MTIALIALVLMVSLAFAGQLPRVTEPGAALIAISVDPAEITLAGERSYQMVIWASFEDGERRDITSSAETMYDSSDPSIAWIDEHGVIEVQRGAITGEEATISTYHQDRHAELQVKVKNSLSATIEFDAERGLPLVTNPDGLDVVVNKQRNLPRDYEPGDLVVPDVPFAGPEQLLRLEAARALEELFLAAGEAGHGLAAVSGYRSYASQEAIFGRNVAQVGFEEANRFSAQPGQSEHQTGLAMDVSSTSVGFRLVERFGETPEGLWLAENAADHGFIIRYPRDKEEITGYIYEPWHLRYVGERLASEITRQGVTLEEHLGG